MSRSAESQCRRDGGFTLIEIVVALGIVMVVAASLLPQLVAGIQATSTARTVSQAKGVLQGELDRMRNLPFYVTPAAGPGNKDVLDYYFPGLGGPGAAPACTVAGKYVAPALNSTGYVETTATTRCSYEPATGAFYRSVTQIPPAPGAVGFTVVVSTQFLSGATPPQPIEPAQGLSGYNSASLAYGRATPPASQIGVWIAVLYSTRGTVHPVTSYTQLYDQPSSTMRARAEVSATILEVGSSTESNGAVSLAAGLLNLVGSLNYASTVTGNVNSVSAGFATGQQGSGASANVAAPPATAASTTNVGAGGLSGCSMICWGGTRIDRGDVSADGGLPTAGGPAAPMQALLTGLETEGLHFDNNDNESDYRTDLDLKSPLLRVDPNAVARDSGTTSSCTPGTGPAAYVGATGYVRTTSATPATVEACVIGRSSAISLFRTGFAPRGVIQVELVRGVARCTVSGTSHAAAATADYEAVVRYWNGSGYQTAATIVPSNAIDPLIAVPLTTSVGSGHTLGEYVASWSSLTADRIVKTQAGGHAEVRLPGVVTIVSQPVWKPDVLATGNETSAVSITLGALRCSALDQR